MDYLLLSAEEFSCLNLGPKEKLLWKSVRRLDAGEVPSLVAMDIVKEKILTKNDLKVFKKWLKIRSKTRPKSVLAPLGKRGRL